MKITAYLYIYLYSVEVTLKQREKLYLKQIELVSNNNIKIKKNPTILSTANLH